VEGNDWIAQKVFFISIFELDGVELKTHISVTVEPGDESLARAILLPAFAVEEVLGSLTVVVEMEH
jgi:hypothetical protein